MIDLSWAGSNVLVTGGASFIGSHLVDSLLKNGASVVVADDFSSGRLSNLIYEFKEENQKKWAADDLDVFRGDLKDRAFTRSLMSDIDVVFHLAAKHGGRGYIHSHPVECCTNMMLDQLVFEEAFRCGVDRVCFASSACVYPQSLQSESGSVYLLKEVDADPFVEGKAFPDLEYGWAKFMAEMSLQAYHRQYGMKTSAVRIFSSYGPRENESHAVVALIAKAFIERDPFVIWSTGLQERNFTHVQDIVDALMVASTKITDGGNVNAGRDDRINLNRTAELIFEIVGWKPKKIIHDVSKPMGVASRAADLTKARDLLGWEPKIGYEEGFQRTIDWYYANKDVVEVRRNLDHLLFEV